MSFSSKKVFIQKIISIILYVIFNLIGFPLLFLFSPRNLLYNEKSENDKIKLILFRDFSKSIYENINTPLIKNLIITEEACPNNYETLTIKNQYYGNFTKFYKNKRICIERYNNEEYTFINLLKLGQNKIQVNRNKECGPLIKNSNIVLNISEEMTCPLNHIDIETYSRAQLFEKYFQIDDKNNYYMITLYGNANYPVITNLEIVNNYKLCLERHINFNNLSCEFPDNNECFIEDEHEKVFTLELDDKYKLIPSNLANWNLINNDNINHFFCKDDLRFNIFAYGYINFTDSSLEQFLKEFPPNDYTNNPLYKAYEVYKFPSNLYNLLYVIAVILFCLSSVQLTLQIMLIFEKVGIRRIYLIYGMILFILKCISYFGMVIIYYQHFLKIEKVYLVMDDKPRNQILKYYSSNRYIYIAKSISICLSGFLMICIEFIIIIFIYIFKWGINIQKFENKDKEIGKINIKNGSTSKFTNGGDIISDIEKPANSALYTNDNNNGTTGTFENSNNTLNEITLKFVSNNNLTKSYILKIDKAESFESAINKLKEKYSELKDIKMTAFNYGSNIINKEKTLSDNKLENNATIFIL